MITRRKLAGAASLSLAGALAAPAVALAETRRWRMVTSWPKRLPGPGISAERVAERILALSGGRIAITVHAAGEMVPAFEVLDAVGSGVAEMGHTAAFYWQGKAPAAVFYTTVPFGLTPPEHVAWIDAGGGQALWDELYAPFGVKPFMGGNTGICMGGWFRRELARARTFGFMRDVSKLWSAGYALGATFDNTLVVTDNRILNPEGTRFPDEFVRHKVLDAIGDLALAGGPLLGTYRTVRGGHKLNYAVVCALISDKSAWTWTDTWTETWTDRETRRPAREHAELASQLA